MRRNILIILSFVLMSLYVTACGGNLLAASIPTTTPTSIPSFTTANSITSTYTLIPTETSAPTTLTPTYPGQEGQTGSFFELHSFRLMRPGEKDIATIPSIWDAYHLSGMILTQPGSKLFKVTMLAAQPLIVPWFWCAKKGLLEDNLAHIKVDFLVELQPVPDSFILKYPSLTSAQGFECRTWAVKIPWILQGESGISIRYILDEAISDGASTYPAGKYTIQVNITTQYKKKFTSEKYGFSITLPADIDVQTYNPVDNGLISAYLHQKHLADGGDLNTHFYAWVENKTDRCHPKLTASANIPVKMEQVTIGGIPYIKIFTPNLYGDYMQDIEYMTYGTDFCVHFTISLNTYYFDQGDAQPGNMLPYMEQELDHIVSTFRWIKP